ncbi:MAG TPA: hypothetical protein VH396_22060 [Chitinophagaceae bacterium]|jgi:hypothetical protein
MKVIKSYTELYELHQHLRKFDLYHKGEKYKFQLPQFDTAENNRVSRIINDYSEKCGGSTKNFAMGIAFAIYVVYYFSKGGTFSSLSGSQIISLAVCTLLGAIAGKLSGVIYFRWKMIKFIGKLLATGHFSSYQHSFSKL